MSAQIETQEMGVHYMPIDTKIIVLAFGQSRIVCIAPLSTTLEESAVTINTRVHEFREAWGLVGSERYTWKFAYCEHDNVAYTTYPRQAHVF